MKEIESKTSAKIITDTFVRIFLIFSLLITIIVSGIVAFTSLQIRKSEGAALLNSVQTAATNGQVNWDEFKLDSEKDEKATFVRLTSPSGQKRRESRNNKFFKITKILGKF